MIAEQLRAATSGQGGVALIEGPAGIGKSRLLEEAVRLAAGCGVPVLHHHSPEHLQLVPLTSLRALIDGPLTPPPPGAMDGRLWLIDQVRGSLEDRVASSPLVVAIDDLESADELTRLAVPRLAAQLSSYPLLWLLATRPGRHSDHPESGRPDRLSVRLEELSETIRIDLGPLAGAEVGELMADVLGAVPTPELLTAGGWAGGNPLLVVELAEWLREQGAVNVSGVGPVSCRSGCPTVCRPC